MNKRKRNQRGLFLPGWIFLPVMAVYCELLLHIWTMEEFFPGRTAAVVIFGLAFGGLLGFAASLLPGKAQKWFAVAVGVLLAVLYLMQFFLNDAYQNFMTFQTIFAGAEGVATDYTALIASLLARNLWRIGLVLLPVVLYAVFARCESSRWQLRGILAGAAVMGYLLGFVVVQETELDAARFTTAYEFDSAVHSFGLNMALVLDTVQGSDAEEPSFVLPEPQATQAPETEPLPETQPQEETDATEAPTEPPVVYEEQVLPIDFAALAASEKKSAIATVHSYVAAQTPSMTNEYTGLFEGKNLILITAEAFTAQVIDPERTPTLYRMATKGIQFTDYYQPAWGASTTSGEFSNLMGIMPTTGGACMKEVVQQDMFLTMGNQLNRLGYTSIAYHNHLHDFYDRDQTHESFGYDQYLARGNGMEDYITVQFPESDLEMMEFSVAQYIDQQPFSIYYMTVSGHSVYSKESNAMARKNFDVVAELDYSTPVKCYLAGNMELEYAMAYLVEQLETAGIADDTVIVISTDHYPYGLESSSTWGNSKDFLSELYGEKCNTSFVRDKNALIIWSGCLEDMDIVVDEPVFSLDILPTLSNLFGVEYDSRLLVGRDVFSDAQPLVFWPNYSWKTEKGSYNASKNAFTPVEGVEVEEGYVKYISSLVKNKVTYSTAVSKNDYFDYVVAALNADAE